MNRDVRVGLVGCGRLAERGYAPALTRVDGIRLVAVADTDPGRCRAVAPRVPAFADASALLDGEDVELLVLAHPAALHVPDARRGAAAGVACLVEKPPAPSAAEAEALLELDPLPWLGFNRRFEPEVEAARAWLAAEPAAVLELQMSIAPSAWGALTGSESALLDLGPHVVDLARWLTGHEPTRVRVRRSTPTDASFELDLNGVRAHIAVSHERGWRERAVVRRSEHAVIVLERGGLARRLAGRLRPRSASPLVDSLAAQLAAAAHAVRGGEPDTRLGRVGDGVIVLRVLDAVAAAASDDWIGL